MRKQKVGRSDGPSGTAQEGASVLSIACNLMKTHIYILQK
jgi:hypothetical protein